MGTPSSIIDRVSELLREVIATEVLPAYGKLKPEDVEQKQTEGDPEDIVSRVDKAVEARLGPALSALLPGSSVVGEEAAHADASVTDALKQDGSIWVIDPIDGTRGFVRGEPAFGVMVALVVDRQTQASWIALPARSQLLVAERGSGAYLDGKRISLPTTELAGLPRGTLYTRYLPEPERTLLEQRSQRRYQPILGSGSAAIEYADVVLGNKDFVVYYRLLPWDHLPGALLVTEAGGTAQLPDRTPFTPRHQVGPLIVATNQSVSAQVEPWFAGIRVD